MSYDVHFEDSDGNLCKTPRHDYKGGTYKLGGNDEASLNITYNYGKRLREILHEKSIRGLYGLTSTEIIPLLDIAIAKLGNDLSEDYWEPTDGNIKTALMYLRRLAILCPNGMLQGD